MSNDKESLSEFMVHPYQRILHYQEKKCYRLFNEMREMFILYIFRFKIRLLNIIRQNDPMFCGKEKIQKLKE